MPESFASRVLDWYDRYGRHDLPWQKNRSLYRVWVSEIMLQQTQVQTVVPYFQRFMRRFPSLKKLAAASVDEVLESWAGLGYYSRGRNLHRAAQQVQAQHGGRIPRSLEVLMELPGIGRSTAAAILSQALDQRHAILDGNVKRVLARYHIVSGWPGERLVEQQLWRYAEQHTPTQRNADYSQAMMDLGATVCRRSRPLCGQCPLHDDCLARLHSKIALCPGKKPKKTLPVKHTRMLLLVAENGAILLEKRPPSGIWGGLWSLPEVAMGQDVAAVCRQRWGVVVRQQQDLNAFRHSFSHYHLQITPCRVRITAIAAGVRETDDCRWLHCGSQRLPAVASPVAKILRRYA